MSYCEHFSEGMKYVLIEGKYEIKFCPLCGAPREKKEETLEETLKNTTYAKYKTEDIQFYVPVPDPWFDHVAKECREWMKKKIDALTNSTEYETYFSGKLKKALGID